MHRYLNVFILCVIAAASPARAEEIATVTEYKINVRGQPSLIGEVVTQLERGDKVTVLERIAVENPKPHEPTNWAKIKLPENTPVWVFSPFIKEGVVSASRLNLRAGPGENYSVLGRIPQGTAVKQIRTVEEWMEIEAPPEAYAFIDSSLIQSESGSTPAAVAAAPAPETSRTISARPDQPESITPTAPDTPAVAATTPSNISQPQLDEPADQPVEEPDDQPVERPSPARAVAPVAATPAPVIPDTPPAIAEAPTRAIEPVPGKRIVRREGIIRATRSIQAPTWYELVHPDTKKVINYLYEEQLPVRLRDYKGQRVIVSGEEGIDSRWPNTPILDVETLDILP